MKIISTLLVSLIAAGAMAQTADLDAKLESSVQELSNIREAVTKEKLPMVRGLNSLEDEVLEVRLELQQVQRQLDSRNLDLNNLRSEIKTRKDEKSYVSNLLGEYIRNFQTRLHIAEDERYKAVLTGALDAPENSNLSDEAVFLKQTDLVEASIKRLQENVGGTVFNGAATGGEDGLVKDGQFMLLGPLALFSAEDGSLSGIAELVIGSTHPKVFAFNDPANAVLVKETVAQGNGEFPFDPTLGDARQMEETKEPFVAFSKEKGSVLGIDRGSHIGKGGYIGLVIILMFLICVGITIFKWIQLARIPTASEKSVQPVLDAMLKKDYSEASTEIGKLKGPTGLMLKAGIDHIEEPKDLVEEVMYEEMLTTKMSVSSLTPFLAVCASSAPLMGLLGTVTGIINTFKVITVKGSGDVKQLSGGISEALITTEFGLVVAISALVLHAFLSRKAKGITDNMEQMAILFINRASRTIPSWDAAEDSK